MRMPASATVPLQLSTPVKVQNPPHPTWMVSTERELSGPVSPLAPLLQSLQRLTDVDGAALSGDRLLVAGTGSASEDGGYIDHLIFGFSIDGWDRSCGGRERNDEGNKDRLHSEYSNRG